MKKNPAALNNLHPSISVLYKLYYIYIYTILESRDVCIYHPSIYYSVSHPFHRCFWLTIFQLLDQYSTTHSTTFYLFQSFFPRAIFDIYLFRSIHIHQYLTMRAYFFFCVFTKNYIALWIRYRKNIYNRYIVVFLIEHFFFEYRFEY